MRNRVHAVMRSVASDQRGSMPVVAAIFASAFVACTVVVIDHHQHLDALSTARETSFNAARAASQKLDENEQRLTDAPVVNVAEARLAASEIVSNVPNTNLQSVDVNGAQVVVIVTVTSDAILGSRTFTGTGRAEAIDPNG